MALFVYLESEQSVSWVKLAADGTVKGRGQGPLTEIDGAGERVIAIVPDEDVLLCSTDVPGQKRRLLAQAVPYALEEQLIDDVDELHFAFGPVSADAVKVAVVSHAKMSHWLELLNDAGLEPEQLIPDVLTLPLKDDAWHLLQLNQRLLLRTGTHSGMAFDVESAEFNIASLINEAGEHKPSVIHRQDFSDTALELTGLDVEIIEEPASGLPLSVMAAAYDDKNSINLLQGPYSRRERVGRYWRPWRAAAGLLLGIVLVQFVSAFVDQQRLVAEKAALEADIEQIYKQTFPQARNTSGAHSKMKSALKKLRGGGSADDSGFAELLAQAGAQFKETDKLAVQRLSYKGGQLDVSMFIGDLQALDQLKQRLVDKGGLQVEIQSATAKGNQVEARLKIKGAAS